MRILDVITLLFLKFGVGGCGSQDTRHCSREGADCAGSESSRDFKHSEGRVIQRSTRCHCILFYWCYPPILCLFDCRARRALVLGAHILCDCLINRYTTSRGIYRHMSYKNSTDTPPSSWTSYSVRIAWVLLIPQSLLLRRKSSRLPEHGARLSRLHRMPLRVAQPRT